MKGEFDKVEYPISRCWRGY